MSDDEKRRFYELAQKDADRYTAEVNAYLLTGVRVQPSTTFVILVPDGILWRRREKTKESEEGPQCTQESIVSHIHEI